MNVATHGIEADEQGLVLVCPKCGQRNRAKYERLEQNFRCGQCHQDLPAPAEPAELAGEGAFDALIARSSLPVLVDFWAPWCGPCKMLAPEIEKIANENAGRWVIGKVNTQDVPSLAQRFAVSAIPTLIVFRAGRETARQPGAAPASGIRQFMSRALAGDSKGR